MTRFGFITKYALLLLLALFGVNAVWIVFIVIVDLFCGVRPQAAVPVFPAIFIGALLLLMVRSLKGVNLTDRRRVKPRSRAATVVVPRFSDAGYARKTILRSMLIIKRKKTPTSTVNGRTL